MRNKLLICLLIFASCSPENRIARILKNNPSLVKTDTIFRKDTLYTKGDWKDSVFNYFQTDTILLKQDKLTIKYFYNHDSTIYLQGKCAPDTIYRNIPIQVNSVNIEQNLTWWDKTRIWLFSNWWWIALIVLLIRWIVKKFYPVRV